MEERARIDHLSVAVNLDSMIIKEDASIGRSNWITGFSSGAQSRHFNHQPDRFSKLVLGRSSSITKKHHIDCTGGIEIGEFSTIAGYHSQLLTHSIDLLENRQDSSPIHIGDYVFIGTNCVILAGSSLPSYCVLGAKSLMTTQFAEEWRVYAGVPAKMIKEIPKDAKYFSRENGFVF